MSSFLTVIGFFLAAVLCGDARLVHVPRERLVVHDVPDAEQAIRLLEEAPVSCVSFDALRHSAHFSVSPDDLYDPRELLLQRPQRRDTTACRTARHAGQAAPVAIMVPTYPPHQEMYNRLVASVRRNVRGPASLLSVFSSIHEGEEMTLACGASCWVEGSKAANSSRSRSSSLLQLQSLVFNYDWKHRQMWGRKVNYQTAKKLWALNHVEVENVLMLDSDFSILRPIVLQEAIAPYERTLYELDLVSLNRVAGKFFEKQLRHIDKVLGKNESHVLHFEQPWIFNHRMVRQLTGYLQQRNGTDFVGFLMDLDFILMEVLLYRRFIRFRADPNFFSQRVHTSKLWSSESANATEAERAAVEPPPIAVHHNVQVRERCRLCWLETHADRRARA